MGLEAESDLETEGATHRVKALLESRELILRGDVRRTFKIADIGDIAAHDGALHFRHDGTGYILRLPPGRADTWARKLTTPPPSLASKLGVSPDKPALVIGSIVDEALAAALRGNTAADADSATQVVVIAETPDALPDPGQLPPLPVWVVYPKGVRSTLPESVVRGHMRSAGWSDTKTCAVSDRLTALRFHRR